MYFLCFFLYKSYSSFSFELICIVEQHDETSRQYITVNSLYCVLGLLEQFSGVKYNSTIKKINILWMQELLVDF